MIQAVIFDMNGVIVNDEPIHEQAFREILKKQNIILTHKLFRKYFLGRSDLAGFQYLSKRYPLNTPLKELQRRKLKRYWQLVKNGIPLVPGILKTINQLASSYRLALTTGATRKEVAAVLKQTNSAKLFEIIVTAEDFTQSKPDPAPYLLTAKKLELLPHDCVVIEDATAGIQSAKAAGMRCIAITTTSKQPLLQTADRIVGTPREITADVVKSLSGIE